MADTISALARLRRTHADNLLPDEPILQLLQAMGVVWRERLLTPLVTLRLFLLQILHGNTSMTHLRQLSGLDFAAASYCEACSKLPIRLLLQLLKWTAQRVASLQTLPSLGNRIVVVDGSNFSMPDTPALRQRFGLPRAGGVKVGVSYPAAKIMAMLDLATGCIRIVRYRTGRRGFRTRQIAIATTLMDSQAWPDEKIAELYGHRWNIETCFGYLKTTMKMNVLKCRSTAGIYRELLMYLVVYNLIRLVMLAGATTQKVALDRISFIDAMRHLAVRLLGLIGAPRLLINPYRPGRHQPRLIRRRPQRFDLMMKPRAEVKNQEHHTETY